MSMLSRFVTGLMRIGGRVNSSTANSVLFIDSSNNLAEDTDLTWDGNTLSLGTGGSATNPLLQLSSNTGFYEAFAGTMTYTSAGTARFSLGPDYITGFSEGSALRATSVTNTVPGCLPRQDDTDTGMGGGGADTLSLIAGGVESLRITETGGTIAQLIRAYVAIGDTTTNFVEIYNNGDFNFVNGAGLQFAEVWAHGVTDVVSSVAQNDWDQIVAFDTNGEANASAVPDHTNDHVTAGVAGRYLIHFSWSGYGPAAAHDWNFHIAKNNRSVTLNNITAHITTPTTQKTATISCQGIVDLSANDTVELWVQRLSAGSNIDLTTVHATISIVQIGGTT